MGRFLMGLFAALILALASWLAWEGFRDPWVLQTSKRYGEHHGWAVGILGVGAGCVGVVLLLAAIRKGGAS